jgi:hypothetical protein
LDSPRLNDSSIGDQLYISASDHPAETRERASCLALDLRRGTAGESAELFRIEERFVDTR